MTSIGGNDRLSHYFIAWISRIDFILGIWFNRFTFNALQMCRDLQKSIATVAYFRLMMENILLLGHVLDIMYAMHFMKQGVEKILLSTKKLFEFWLAFVFVPFKHIHGSYI